MAYLTGNTLAVEIDSQGLAPILLELDFILLTCIFGVQLYFNVDWCSP
jgi:hypothetical protein